MASKNPQNKTAKKTAAARPILLINRSNLFGWISLGFLACALMFVLGVLVGRNQAPIHFDIKRLDEKLANLEHSVLTPSIKPFDVLENIKKNKLPEIHTADPHTLSPQYDKNITETSIPPNTLNSQPPSTALAAKKPAAKNGASTIPKEKILETNRPQPPDPPPVKKPAVSESKRPAPAEATPPRYAGIDGYAIQIISVSDPKSAALVRDRFLAKGYPAYCRKADVNGKTWHRVRIGPYPNKQKAQKDLESLTDAGVSAIVLPSAEAHP